MLDRWASILQVNCMVMLKKLVVHRVGLAAIASTLLFIRSYVMGLEHTLRLYSSLRNRP